MLRFCFLFILLPLHLCLAQRQTEEVTTSESTLRNNRIAAAQERNIPGKQDQDKMPITDYKIISYVRDTTHFDTTLTLQKEYKYNYLRKDDFELLPFSNIGQTYNRLGYTFKNDGIYPKMGIKAKHFNYREVDETSYYYVPTPLTELFFKTAMEQGQLLDAFITLNTSKQLNFSIAYKGLRSLGKYQHILSSTGNFRFTTNYHTKNNKYHLRGHIVTQDMLNQENGGIADESNFESGDEEFQDRSRITVNYENAENLLKGKRYFLEQEYHILQNKDSIHRSMLTLGQRFLYETKSYLFDQGGANEIFGDAFKASAFRDRAKLRSMQNELYLSSKTTALGALTIKALHYRYNYLFKSIIYTDDGLITNQLKGHELAAGGSWKHRIAGIDLAADLLVNVSGKLGGNTLTGSAAYRIDEDKILKAGISIQERMPDFNFLLYQSNYVAYNWQNTESFNPERRQQLQFRFLSRKWLSAYVDFTVLDNYAYFSETAIDDGFQVQPFQSSGTFNYLKIRLEKELKFGKFALYNTFMYQQVGQDNMVLNVPEIVTRNTLYYSGYLFKKALYLQTGFTLKYFTAYNANSYSPLLGEFYVQNQRMIGGFPLVDFFINAKVRQTRIYLKAEHFNSAFDFTNYNFYAAPNYPYRDFIVRFGVVWNFFL